MENGFRRSSFWLVVAARLLVLTLIFGSTGTFFAAESFAQTSPQAGEQHVEWDRTAEIVADLIEKGDASPEVLENIRAKLAAQREAAFALMQSGSLKVRTLDAQIEALGKPPAEGASEPTDIAQRRVELEAARAAANAPILAAREAYKRADLLIKELDAQIRHKTASKLLQRNPSPLLPSSWIHFSEDFITLGDQILKETQDQIAEQGYVKKFWASLPIIAFLVGIGLILLLVAQPYLASRLQRASFEAPGLWRPFFFDIARNLSRLLISSLAAVSLIAAFRLSALTPASLKYVAGALPDMAAVVVLSHWLGHSLFQPFGRRSPLIGVPQGRQVRALRLCQILGVLVAVGIGLRAQGRSVDVAPSTFGMVGSMLVVVGSVAVIGMAFILRYASLSGAEPGQRADGAGSGSGALKIIAKILLYVSIAAVAVSALGLTNLSLQIIFPSIVSVGVVGGFYFTFCAVNRLIELLTGGGEGGQQQTASLLPVIVVIVLSVLALPVLALVWGARTSDIAEVWRLLIEGVEIGETRISMEALIRLVITFAIGILLTGWLQKVLRGTVLPRTRLDAGAQSAIVTGTGYVGITVTALASVSAAGLQLSSLTVVAGALSVGIGFGLQTIVSNFVSGIILLIERPIKEGDWIEVAGHTGFVRKISVRSTRIETFDLHDVIVPNSELIASSVKNMTLSSNRGRATMSVGVAYGSDLEQVRTILLEVAQRHPLVMDYPAPQVVFLGMGESSLDFELRCVLRDVRESGTAKSDMLVAIYMGLQKSGIEIPFPQRDVHLRASDPGTPKAEEKAEAPSDASHDSAS